MKNMKQLSLIAFVLLFSSTASFAQVTPSDDAYTSSTATATNYGTAITLSVSATTTATTTTFIRFDLSSIPSTYTGANIAQATMKLYVNSVTAAGSFNVDYITGAWSEKTIKETTEPGIGTTIVSNVTLATTNKGEYLLIDVTPALQAWLNGTETNYGVALVGNSPVNATLDSKENTGASHPPELDVVYAGIAGVTTAGGSGLVGGGSSGTLNLALTSACATNQVLQWNGSSWVCAAAGIGTITGVTAGSGLTGGGTCGNVALTVDTTKIPELNTGNTFTGTQFIGGTGNSATLQIDANGVNPGSLLPGIRFGVGGSGEGLSSQRTGTGNLNGLDFYTNFTSRIAITNNGSIGIGTRTPAAALDIATGGIYIEGTGDGSGTSLVPNQLLFQDNGEISSLDPSHRIIFDRSNNLLELREYGTILFSPGATGGARTAEIFFTPTAADIFYNFNVSGLTTMGTAVQTAQLTVTSTSPLDGADVNGYSSTIGSGGVGTRGIGAVGGSADPSGVLIASDGVDGTGGSSIRYLGGSGVGGTGGTGSAGGAGGVFNGGAGTQDGGVGVFAYGYGYGGPESPFGGTGGEFFGGGGTSGGGDGLYANAFDSANYAGNFNGNVNVTGTLSAATKNFRIDHPLDPANKYLVHASVESSELMDIYTGNATTDDAGGAVVHLPDWFETLNTDFRYQLTVIGQFAQAIVSGEISNHQFSIKTDKPNVRVSWQVTGVRQDAYAKTHPLVVEQAKTGKELGHYLHPALYGAGEEQSIAAAQHPEATRFARELRERSTRVPVSPAPANEQPATLRTQAIAAAAAESVNTARPSFASGVEAGASTTERARQSHPRLSPSPNPIATAPTVSQNPVAAPPSKARPMSRPAK